MVYKFCFKKVPSTSIQKLSYLVNILKDLGQKWIKACLQILHGFIISITMFGYETMMKLVLHNLIDGIDDGWPRTLHLKLFIVSSRMSNPYFTITLCLFNPI
jgi:hypothetical protein